MSYKHVGYAIRGNLAPWYANATSIYKNAPHEWQSKVEHEIVGLFKANYEQRKDESLVSEDVRDINEYDDYGLPISFIIKLDDVEYQEMVDSEDEEEYISNYITNEYGYCHNGFKYEFIDDDIIQVYDVQWDVDDEDLDYEDESEGDYEENFLSEAISSKDITDWCDTTEQEETLKLINRIAKRENVSLRFGTKVGKYPQSLIIDHDYQDNAIRIYPNGACTIKDKKFGDYKDDNFNIKVFEKDIKGAIKELSTKKEESKDYSCTIVLLQDNINELNELLGSTANRAGWDIEQVAFDEECIFEDGTIGKLLVEIGEDENEVVEGEYSLSNTIGKEYFRTIDKSHTIRFNKEGKSYTINVVDGSIDDYLNNKKERANAKQSLRHTNKSSKNESLQLTEGHQVQDYKGFELDLNTDLTNHSWEDEEYIITPTIEIKYKGKTLATTNGYRKAREWVDKHVTFKKYTMEEKLQQLADILVNDRGLDVDVYTNLLNIDGVAEIYALSDGSWAELYTRHETYKELLENGDLSEEELIAFLKDHDMYDEADSNDIDDIIQNVIDVSKENIQSVGGPLTYYFDTFNDLVDNSWTCTQIESEEDIEKLKKDSYLTINGERIEEKLIQSASDKALQQNIKTEIDSGKSPKQAAAIAYSIKRKNESVNESNDVELVNGYIVYKVDRTNTYFVMDGKGYYNEKEFAGKGYPTKEQAIERANSLEKGVATTTMDEKFSVVNESNIKKEVPQFLWTDVCSNKLDKVKTYFEKHPNLLNRRYNRFGNEHSLIMGALRNQNIEMVKLLQDLGETILDNEKKEYDFLMSSNNTTNSNDELEEGLFDNEVMYKISIKCNDNPFQRVSFLSTKGDLDKAISRAKNYYQHNYSVYADDRQNKWVIEYILEDYVGVDVPKEYSKNNVVESYDDDDYYDDYEQAGIYGGDLTYCPLCDRRLVRDEDGDSYCPNCKDDAHSLSMKRRALDKGVDINESTKDNSGDELIKRATHIYTTKLNPNGNLDSPFDDEQEYIDALEDDLKVKEYAKHFIKEWEDSELEEAKEFIKILKEYHNL